MIKNAFENDKLVSYLNTIASQKCGETHPFVKQITSVQAQDGCSAAI